MIEIKCIMQYNEYNIYYIIYCRYLVSLVSSREITEAALLAPVEATAKKLVRSHAKQCTNNGYGHALVANCHSYLGKSACSLVSRSQCRRDFRCLGMIYFFERALESEGKYVHGY